MAYKILDVGQCDADNYRISEVLTDHFDVEMARACSHEQAIDLASQTAFDLILINRLYDRDGSEGLKTLKALKSNDLTANIPVMLVSNFPDAQNAALEAGAVPGFGKASLANPSTIELLSQYLKDSD